MDRRPPPPPPASPPPQDRAAQRELRDERRYLLALRHAIHQTTVVTPGDEGLRRLDQCIDALARSASRYPFGSRWRRWLAAIRDRG